MTTFLECWGETKDCPMPKGCNPCRLCKGMCMEAEMVEDYDRKIPLVRITAMCDASVDQHKDDIRTEFAPETEAVAEWNRMNP